MDSLQRSQNFQLGFLHLVHLLTMVDGVIDERERTAIQEMIEEEKIPIEVLTEFETRIKSKSEKDLYRDGLDLLNLCNDNEKKRAFVYLYQLSEADDKVHVKEVRLLLYSLKAVNIEFEEVESMARSPRTRKHPASHPDTHRAA